MHSVILHKSAVKSYEKAGASLKELKGELKNNYPFRLGDLRIIYEIEEEMRTVRVKTINTRGSAYKHTSS